MSSGGIIPGDSIVDSILQSDTLRLMLIATSFGCPTRKIVDSQIVVPPTNTKLTERWIVESCGTLIKVRVEFTVSLNGGTDIRTSIE